ncbi:MAG: TrbI/VirB10 family protein [Pseudomonadota bacterium]
METPQPTSHDASIAAEMRLRPDPPRVMRLSRRAIAVAATGFALVLATVVISSLDNNEPPASAQELISIDRVQTADGLARLPQDYGDVPRLGPPLPGEFGRAILNAQDRGQPIPAPATATLAPANVDPAEQARLQEQDAARLSALFAETRTSRTSATVDGQSQGDTDAGATNEKTTSSETVIAPASPYLLQAGSIIPAALITGLSSAHPGPITAQVTSHVYDSPTGRYLLVPQGARLIGAYDTETSVGQNRLRVVWTRLVLPDGRSISLDRTPGADATGASGLKDRVDRNWGGVFRAAAITTLLNLGTSAPTDSDDAIAQAIRDATQDTIGQTGQEIVRQQLAIPPTLTVRPGFPVRALVTRDLVLEPLGEIR